MYLAFYNTSSYENLWEAEECGGLYVSDSPVHPPNSATLLSQVDVAAAALAAMGVDEETAIFIIDSPLLERAVDVNEVVIAAFRDTSQFWDRHSKFIKHKETEE